MLIIEFTTDEHNFLFYFSIWFRYKKEFLLICLNWLFFLMLFSFRFVSSNYCCGCLDLILLNFFIWFNTLSEHSTTFETVSEISSKFDFQCIYPFETGPSDWSLVLCHFRCACGRNAKHKIDTREKLREKNDEFVLLLLLLLLVYFCFSFKFILFMHPFQ